MVSRYPHGNKHQSRQDQQDTDNYIDPEISKYHAFLFYGIVHPVLNLIRSLPL